MFANNIKQYLTYLCWFSQHLPLTLESSDLVQFHAEADGTSEQHYTAFPITCDAEQSAKIFRIENIPSGQKTWNHWLWMKVICKRLTASFALSCAIDFKQTMLAFSTTWVSSVWLTLLKHVSVVRNFVSCLSFFFFFLNTRWFYSSVSSTWTEVLDQRWTSTTCFQLVTLMLVRVIIRLCNGVSPPHPPLILKSIIIEL